MKTKLKIWWEEKKERKERKNRCAKLNRGRWIRYIFFNAYTYLMYFVYIYIYICVCIYIYTHIYTCTHTHTQRLTARGKEM